MNKENEYHKITDADLTFLEKELMQEKKAFIIKELTEKLAFRKTSSQLQQQVKKYDPFCKYEEGDLIYKEYDEPLMVSSKGAKHFKGSVVLKVLNKIKYENFNCEMLEVGYSGGGTFRKHIDYMRKTNTQVLLPSNYENKDVTPDTLKKEEDPRRDHVPMTDKDLKKLEKNLNKALSKSDAFFCWNNFWQLKHHQLEISESQVKKIKNFFLKTKQSVETEYLCSKFFKKKPEDDEYELCCLSLNHILENTYKKSFVSVSPLGWGKWHLREVLDSFMNNLPLSSPSATVPPFEDESEIQKLTPPQFPLKIYLTWREILSGGVRIPKNLKKLLAEFREYTFTDTEKEKDYTVYYYPSPSVFLGLKDFYQRHSVPQGASLNLEQKEPGHINIWLKKSKKKLSVPEVSYDPKSDTFSDTGKEVFTFSLPNKIIHLERDTLVKLFSLYEQRKKLDLRELLKLAYNHFGLEGETLLLHYLRAFHLVDVLKRTTQEDVQKTLLLSPEFTKSEKKKGIFLYTEKVKAEEEVFPEEPGIEAPEGAEAKERAEAQQEAPLAIGTIAEEVPAPEAEEEIVVKEEKIEEEAVEEKVKPPEPPKPPSKEAVEEPKKAAPPRKKRKVKMKGEAEAAPRRRKGEKKLIEERIELEEFEQEAMYAVKTEEKKEEPAEKAAASKKKKKEEYKPFVSEEPTFGVFAEKLKSALGDKKNKGEEEEEEAAAAAATEKDKEEKKGKKSPKKQPKKSKKKSS